MMRKLSIKFSCDAILLAATLIICSDYELIIPWIMAVFIHEAGHVFAIILLGGTIDALTVNAGGLKISYNSKILSYKHALICAITGPALGLVSAFAASHLGFTVYAGISLCINIFNLIPVRPLDGGKILLNLTSIIFDRPEKIIVAIELIFLTALFGASLWLLMTTGAGVLFFITCVLTFYYCKER